MNAGFYHHDDDVTSGRVGARYALLVFLRFLTRRKVARINVECDRLREKMLEQKRLHVIDRILPHE